MGWENNGRTYLVVAGIKVAQGRIEPNKEEVKEHLLVKFMTGIGYLLKINMHQT